MTMSCDTHTPRTQPPPDKTDQRGATRGGEGSATSRSTSKSYQSYKLLRSAQSKMRYAGSVHAGLRHGEQRFGSRIKHMSWRASEHEQATEKISAQRVPGGLLDEEVKLLCVDELIPVRITFGGGGCASSCRQALPSRLSAEGRARRESHARCGAPGTSAR